MSPPAEAFLAALTGRSRAAFTACTCVDVQVEDPLSDGPQEGVEALADHVARLWTMIPDLRLTPTAPALRGEEGLVALAVRADGTHLGRLADVPVTRRRLSLHAMLVLELAADGRVRRARAFYDPWDAGVQLGLLPRRGTVRGRALLALSGWGLTRR